MLVRDNQVYDEWIVRDQGAMVRQIGYSPEEFAKLQSKKKVDLIKQSKLLDKIRTKTIRLSPNTSKINSAGEKYSKI